MLRFFDCDIGVLAAGVGLPTAKTSAELLKLLDHYAIERAMVYDRGAAESGVFDSFDRILRFCHGNSRLLPTIPVAPPATGESPPPDELIGILREKKIAGVRVWPKLHGFNFNAHVFGPLFTVLERHRVPVLYQSMALQDFPWEHRSDWEGIREVATAFPRLPLIVVYTGMLENRRIFPVLEACPNVLTDLTCASFQYLETVVARFGSRRLVLASHLPQFDPALQTTWFSYSGVPEPAREDIAYNTAARLAEWSQRQPERPIRTVSGSVPTRPLSRETVITRAQKRKSGGNEVRP